MAKARTATLIIIGIGLLYAGFLFIPLEKKFCNVMVYVIGRDDLCNDSNIKQEFPTESINKDLPDSQKPEHMFAGYEKRSIAVHGKSYMVWVADTPEKQERGLMYVTKLGRDQGMLFVFSDRAVQTFWNMNTLIPLDLFWMNDDRVVGTSSMPAIEGDNVMRVSSPEPVNRVLEVLK